MHYELAVWPRLLLLLPHANDILPEWHTRLGCNKTHTGVGGVLKRICLGMLRTPVESFAECIVRRDRARYKSLQTT
jgi:hypothetical protein